MVDCPWNGTEWVGEETSEFTYDENVIRIMSLYQQWDSSVYVNSEMCTTTYAEIVTGITDVVNLDGSVFPNPSYGLFTVNGTGVYTLEVYDIGGRIVNTSNGNGQTEIDLSHLQAGIYMLSLIQGNNREVTRIVTH